MKLRKRFMYGASIIFLTLIVCLAAFSSATPVTAAPAEGLTYEEVMARAIDPQSWKLQEDMLWKELKPNPVIDWMTELNTDGLVNPKATGNKDPIRGALLLVDYWDRPFVTTLDLHTDLLGYYLFDQYGKYEDTVTKNPIIHIDVADYTQWIADYLNKNSALNHYRSIDEYWREASYGKWAIELDSYGPYTLQGFEFEFSPSYNTFLDFPPTFRRAASGTSGSRNLVNESVALAWQNDVFLGDYDFFFILHAGYDESNVWYEFGMMQWAKPEDVPYEYGPGAKMEEIEEILTANPELLLALETTFTSYSSTTPVLTGYTQSTVLSSAVAEVKERKAAGTLDEFEFKFPPSDWDWYDNYTWGNAAPTRYVAWTSWIAAMSCWSASSSATVPRSPENGGGSRSVSYSQQGESDAMGTFAHEFGHIVSHTDNYEASMWTQNVSPKTDYWDLMSRGDKVGPGGYHARWTIPGGQEAGGSPGHFMMFPKRRAGYYDAGDLLELSVAQIKANTPVVTKVVSRNIPMNNAGFYPQLEQYGLKAPNYYKGIMLEFDSENPDASTLVTSGYSNTRYRAGWTGIEVVDRTGYDSFQSDQGVLISRLVSGNLSSAQNRWLIDSHLYDIGLVDFYRAGDPTYYCIGHADQLNDALFHAGTSSTDTGYYSGNYTVNADGTFVSDSGTKHGSIRQWEERDGRNIISGDTVNEYNDTANKLHFYILDKHYTPAKYGEFLSYSIGIRHDEGKAVEGGLTLTKGAFTPATTDRYAIQHFTLKHINADATDIIRIAFDGGLAEDAIILNNIYALDDGESVGFDVFVKAPAGGLTDFPFGLTVSAKSETNAEKEVSYVRVNTGSTGGGGGGGAAVNDSTLSTTTATYDGKDVVVTITLNGNTVKDVKLGAVTLKKGTDYTVSGNSVTFKADYLDSLNAGKHIFTIIMSAGKELAYTITIEDEVAPDTGYKPMTPIHPAGTKVDATKTNNPLIVGEDEMDFPAVKIADYNWIKLRDFAKLLMETTKKFSVIYDEETGIIDVRTGGAYQPIGDELEDKLADKETAISSPQKLRVDGEFIDVAAYNIKGYNYFRLRDLAIILDFAVIYEEETGVVTLDFTKPYGIDE